MYTSAHNKYLGILVLNHVLSHVAENVATSDRLGHLKPLCGHGCINI